MSVWAFLGACLLILSPSKAWSQSRFSDEALLAWAAEANGRPCETQLFGFLAPPDAPSADRASGAVLLIFDTQFADGAVSVANLRVFASDPSGAVDEAAINLARQFRFPESMRNCQGLRAELRFRAGRVAPADAIPPLNAEAALSLAESHVGQICAPLVQALRSDTFLQTVIGAYPQRALERGREGVAVLRFTVSPEGAIESAAVLDELPGGWGFGDAAVQALQLAVFPRQPTHCENAALSVHFILR